MGTPHEEGAWFVRFPVWVMRDPFILENASAADWRVLGSICIHQGWKRGPRHRRTFPLSIARTTQEARCSRRQTLRSVEWWTRVGALKIKKERRLNVYEVVATFQVPPGIGARQSHTSPRNPNRDAQGRYVPSAVTAKVPAKGTDTVPAKGTHYEKSFKRDLLQEPPRPSEGSGPRPPASSPVPPLTQKPERAPRRTPSGETEFRALIKRAVADIDLMRGQTKENASEE
jgi:hypothetical protein